MEHINVFSKTFENIVTKAVKSVQLEVNEKDEESSKSSDEWSSSNEKKSCSYCRVQFPDSQIQRDHYKLDWHRYNLKQSLLSKLPISEEDFNEKTGNDDLSSISGSDSEKEETLDTFATAQGKIFLRNEENKVLSLYKCLMFEKKEDISDEILLNRLRNCCVSNQQWSVLMLGGGHFAGAVFKGTEPIVHKTFHCYTVRAGQGGAQSSRDSKSGGSQPKSAGASLRRYNEQALVQHVKSIIETWKTEIDNSSLIIYRASGPYNRSVLFGGSAPLLDKTNSKLRTIPFSTRRATFTEVKRVHQLLSSVTVYDSLEVATDKFSKQISPDRNKNRVSSINRSKSREVLVRPLPTEHLTDSDLETETNEEVELSTNDLEVSFQDLQEFDDSLTPEQRKKFTKKKKPKKSKTKKLKEQDDAKKKELIDVISRGDIDKLKLLFDDHLKLTEENEKCRDEFMNKILDDENNTLLHVASSKEQIDIMAFLLENDGNPCLKNKKQYTAYTCTQSKEVRDFLRKYAKHNPEKHDYNKAQIPTNVLTSEEIADKKKIIRKIKREREREKKKENEIKKKEEVEKQRFLDLSDREKRALAAERRIISQSGKVTTRCFLCGADIAGKVPFEYMKNLFCSIECLKAHRMQNPVVLS